MNREELNKALEELNMHPGRGLGQNFLQDNNLLKFIVKNADIKENDLILEVGPGFGALTNLMLDAGAKVYSLEYDHRLIGYLKKHIQNPNFTLIEGDACKVKFPEFIEDGVPFSSIANLPYAISTVYLARLLELKNPPYKMVFMLQKEMGQRLSAVPGIKNYGSLSVRTQLLYDVKILRVVPPDVFFPPPAVESAIVQFELKKELPESDLIKKTNTLVKVAFAQRRKQLGKVLSNAYNRELVENVFTKLGIAWEIRPDKLSVEDFLNLAKHIYQEAK